MLQGIRGMQCVTSKLQDELDKVFVEALCGKEGANKGPKDRKSLRGENKTRLFVCPLSVLLSSSLLETRDRCIPF